ncbi:hypothetical protein AB4876_03015 [Zhongshania guokunii]|uniref:Uncharacterized protein n=1 Tax=Zhongshania guokunii TaxID=641783 RepID=A0ABV3U217_9GAMM
MSRLRSDSERDAASNTAKPIYDGLTLAILSLPMFLFVLVGAQ